MLELCWHLAAFKFENSRSRSSFRELKRDFKESKMTTSRDVGAYLSEQQHKSSGDIAQEWGYMEELYNKKLVYQISVRFS